MPNIEKLGINISRRVRLLAPRLYVSKYGTVNMSKINVSSRLNSVVELIMYNLFLREFCPHKIFLDQFLQPFLKLGKIKTFQVTLS